jgi:FO synthase
VQALADAEGLARAGCRPTPMVWQDPDELVGPSGDDGRWRDADAGQPTTALRRDSVLRADAEAVYGDSGLIAADALGTRQRVRSVARRTTVRPQVASILRRAEAGRAVDEDEALLLFDTAGPELAALCQVADSVRADRVGDLVTYVVNRNINFTNICYTGCRFCAFAQRRDDPDAYFLSLEQVADRAEEAWQQGATEVCMQGGIHPDLGGDYYFELVRAIKERVPDLHVHAFSPMEIANGASRLGISVTEFLTEAKAAGLGTIPGTAAEILDDEVRWVLTKGKLPAEAWVEVVSAAHRLGIRSSSTMMFGHVDEPRHWAAHLHLLRRLQLRNLDRGIAGFTEFVPLPFVHRQAPIYLAGLARPGPDFDDVLRVHAVARLVLQGAIDNVQLSWVKVGLEGAVALLRAGANDLGGTLMEETISRMAGSDHGVRQDPETLRGIATKAGRCPPSAPPITGASSATGSATCCRRAPPSGDQLRPGERCRVARTEARLRPETANRETSQRRRPHPRAAWSCRARGGRSSSAPRRQWDPGRPAPRSWRAGHRARFELVPAHRQTGRAPLEPRLAGRRRRCAAGRRRCRTSPWSSAATVQPRTWRARTRRVRSRSSRRCVRRRRLGS